MKFAYKFNNLLGTVYRKGNLLFSSDGNSVISPVGNRLTIYDLKNNKSQTLGIESKFNCTCVDLSPNGSLLVVANEDGQAFMISMLSQTVIYKYKFNKEPRCIKFSPCGRHFAVCVEHLVYVFKAPGFINGQFNTFVVERIFYDTHDDIAWMDWSDDSRCIVVGSTDNSVRVYGIKFMENFRPYTLGGHADEIVNCSFEENSLNMNTLSRNGQLCLWHCTLNFEDLVETELVRIKEEPSVKRRKEQSDDEVEDDINAVDAIEKSAQELQLLEQKLTEHSPDNPEDRDAQGKLIIKEEDETIKKFFYKRVGKHYLMNDLKKLNYKVKLTSAAYHKKVKLLVTAYSNGAFYLHELPDVTLIHSLNISENAIDTVCFNNTGDWLALGVSGAGQLLVWEWQSEQYIMKQQGHASIMNTISYSADGNFVVSGGHDGKLKIWNVISGFCTVTFSEHTSAISALKFSSNKKFFVSASLDGTVRAYDMTRYRNFRTFTAPRLVQFSCVALDHSGELVAAGAQDDFDIYLWSIKFGRLLEVLSGHESPVMTLDFSPVSTSSTLVSGSWDRCIKVWNCLEANSAHETIEVLSDVVCVAFKPNGEEVAVATLNGTIAVFDVKSNTQLYSIEGKNDVGYSKSEDDIVSAKRNMEGKCFTSITYSADGECILAGGRSKYVCIYHVKEGLLLKKFEITKNYSLDGMNEYINRRNLTEFGNLALIEERDVLEGGNIKLKLPGTQKNDLSTRNYKPEISVYSLEFSPNGQQWVAATTEGLMIYSLDKGIVFDPYQLSIEVTPKTARNLLANQEYSGALIMALKLNEQVLTQEIVEQIPHKEIDLVLDNIPVNFIQRVVEFSTKMMAGQHLEFYLKWICSLLTKFGQKQEILKPQMLVNLHQVLNRKYDALNTICDYNKYTIKIIRNIARLKKEAAKKELEANANSEDEDMELIKTSITAMETDSETSEE